MKTLEMAKATAPLAEYAQGVRKEPVILTVSGKPVAAICAAGRSHSVATLAAVCRRPF